MMATLRHKKLAQNIRKYKTIEIKPYSKNAKVHPDKQLKQIAKSIKEFGWQQPIVVDKDGVIIVGHGRWFAYEKYKDEMNLPKPEIKVAKNLTKEQVKAYRLADNKLNESDWDMGLAIEELKELSDEMFDLTGFDKDLIGLNEIEKEEIDFERLGLIMIFPPESPKLKERIGIYCNDIENYRKIKKAVENGELNEDILLKML